MTADPAPSPSAQRSVVLVHGAWHGAWCFDRVVRLLQDADVDVVAVDLPGHGASDEPFTDLFGDAAEVAAQIDGLVADGRAADGVVLLGHSYGGAVVTQAGVHPAVAHVVYLCAFAIDSDGSVFEVMAEEAPDLDADGLPSLIEEVSVQDDGLVTIAADRAAAHFYNLCDEATTAWAVERLGPQPTAGAMQSPTSVAWRERPTTYVVCAEDKAIHPDIQRRMAQRCTRQLEWATGHSPFASDPHLVADLLIGLARA